MMLPEREVLALHREIVEIPSVSGDEEGLADFLEAKLRHYRARPERVGNSLLALAGEGPVLLLDTHLDTVPPAPGWTRDPWKVVPDGERIHGLGSNDAKAAVAGMIAAFARCADAARRDGFRLLLLLTCQEEVGGKGAEAALPELAARGLRPDAAVVGEPTSLDLAVAQKGLLVLELVAEGRAVHAAHGRALGAPNAVRRLARDLVALDGADFGPDDPWLGPTTVEPTQVSGGVARNMIPPSATCLLDVRTNPSPDHERVTEVLRARVREAELRVVSARLRPKATAPDAAVVRAARRARPEAKLFGSRGVSDWCFFECPTVKAGPGDTERSHTPDEWVAERDVARGAAFYEALALAYAAEAATEAVAGAAP